MFRDSNAWPPAPDGRDPPPRPAPRSEKLAMTLIGLVLLAIFIGPIAGSSVIEALVAMVRSLRH